MLKPHIAQALKRENLTAAQAEEAMHIIMTGQATPAQIGAYLVALRMKGETVEEITGSARAMRARRDDPARIDELLQPADGRFAWLVAPGA